ncbi:lipase family alpha/beta hydrolase [Mycolicibacterium litorale]|uniref:Permease n=1 Tax=Mycolicibacterium litorale TaxID=758802 RepID=A0AAD1ILY9_9MYCO|nr:alpha/beta fold hydrolase [Mycolicibacterium litorale]MCV7416179.1 alpha/beta hydrolase [Mycolicibacterium litorale]TDY09430.1 triacylglycerol esterase/lipase EstA (alpha/beta hydrolase family) [Mycolicibacterium litorale]BBY17376.1 permease [Mycolicibacterium litorale]
MRATEIKGLGEVAAEGVTVLRDVVQGLHTGIASRVFTSVGPAARPVEIIHDAIAQTVYAAVGMAGQRLPEAVGAVAATRLQDDTPIDQTPAVAEAIAALNGIYGDELAARGNALATTMAVRVGGRSVDLAPAPIADAFPDATNRIAVFVHGLCQTETSWRRPPRPGVDAPDPRPYGARLRDDLGFTPIDVRYNTGLHISSNGHALDELLTSLTGAWPVPVTDIALVGHSMGGLVVRSACHYGSENGRPWTGKVRQVVCLGSPHLGADLEKSVNAASWALARLRETRAIADFLNLRSDGIKDLRFGACLDDDWGEADPDEFLRDRCAEVPFLDGASYHFVATSAAPRPVGLVFGDHLVRPSSAAGRGRKRRLPFEEDNGLVLTGLHHFDLLNHPDVYDRLVHWLGVTAT